MDKGEGERKSLPGLVKSVELVVELGEECCPSGLAGRHLGGSGAELDLQSVSRCLHTSEV